MDPNDYFHIAYYIAKVNQKEIPNEIFFRTAINRLYYGIFHLVQIKFNILIPEKEFKRCHAYVKEKIEESKIKSDYADLEEYRVEVDYKLLNQINYNHYNDALKIQQRILTKISSPDFIPYEDNDEYFYSKKKSKYI